MAGQGSPRSGRLRLLPVKLASPRREREGHTRSGAVSPAPALGNSLLQTLVVTGEDEADGVTAAP